MAAAFPTCIHALTIATVVKEALVRFWRIPPPNPTSNRFCSLRAKSQIREGGALRIEMIGLAMLASQPAVGTADLEDGVAAVEGCGRDRRRTSRCLRCRRRFQA